MTTHSPSRPSADLTIEVFTTPGRRFASGVTPEGPGDEPTWSPMSATLIYGDHDAVLATPGPPMTRPTRWPTG
jgi:hypothetical protein